MIDDLKNQFCELKTAINSPRLYFTNCMADIRNRIDISFELLLQQSNDVVTLETTDHRLNQSTMIAEIDSFEKKVLQSNLLGPKLDIDISDLEIHLTNVNSSNETKIDSLIYKIYSKFLEVERNIFANLQEEIIFFENLSFLAYPLLVVVKGTFISQKRISLSESKSEFACKLIDCYTNEDYKLELFKFQVWSKIGDVLNLVNARSNILRTTFDATETIKEAYQNKVTPTLANHTQISGDVFSGFIANGVELSHTKLKHIDPFIFRDHHQLRMIVLTENQYITQLDSKTFTQLSNLEKLIIVRNKQLTTLAPNLFQDLKNLKWLSLHCNQISSIESSLFKNLTSLEKLTLFSNILESLNTESFKCLRKLKLLNLHDNRISYLDSNLFDQMEHLKSLILSENRLKDIGNVFKGLSRLETLNLEFNQIVSLNSLVFKEMKNLRVIELKGNRLEAFDFSLFEGLIYLEEVNLAGNKLTNIESNLEQTLAHLGTINLNDNNLIKLKEKTFKGMANLRQLLIASNNLSELSPKAFMGLNSLEYLCLDNNNLATSVLENFQDLKKLRRLDWNIE